MSTVASGPGTGDGELSPTRARSSRRILDAARRLVEADGLDELSMRRLAEEADLSVRTIYNVFDDKDAVVTALMLQSFEAMDAAVARSEASDPLDRIWETITLSTEASCRFVPRAVVAAVVRDPLRFREVADRWSGTALLLDAVEDAVRSRVLRGDVDPARLVEHAGAMHAQRLGQWATNGTDQSSLLAGVLHAYDLCLLAVARPKARTRLIEHLDGLAPLLPPFLLGPEAPAVDADRSTAEGTG